jgi:hypothetical protein
MRDPKDAIERHRTGHCFYNCGMEITDNIIFGKDEDYQDWILCHGVATGQGEIEGVRYGHAWLECKGLAFDMTESRDNPVVVAADRYREIGRITHIKEYTTAQVRRMIHEHGTWGPWELPEDIL